MATAIDHFPAQAMAPPRHRNGLFGVSRCFLIPHPTDCKLLLLPAGDRWTLPMWSINASGSILDMPTWHTTEPVARVLREQLNLDLPVLRCLRAGDDARYRHWHLFETEPAPVTWTPPAGSRWVGRDELAHLSLEIEGHRWLLDQWFAEATDPEALAGRLAWYRPGWRAEAERWIDEQLRQLRISAVAPVEQLRLRERSCEFLIRTTGGTLRFKATPPLFAHEGPLLGFLAKTFPGQVPAVLARDDARGWMLVADHSERSLLGERWQGVEGDEVHWSRALRQYAELQIASVPHLPELRVLGVPSRQVEELPGKLDTMLADPATLCSTGEIVDAFGRCVGTITRHHLDRLREITPALTAYCQELASSTAIPTETLVHFNCFPEYFAPTENGYALTDWQDSAVAHPFLDFEGFLVSIAPSLSRNPRLRGQLQAAYLEPWAEFAPRKDVERLLAVARRVVGLQYSAYYALDVLPAMHARWEKESVLLDAVRLLIDSNTTRLPCLPSPRPSKGERSVRPNQLPRSMRRLQRLATER